jgi:uncharacterized protein with NRDE domain
MCLIAFQWQPLAAVPLVIAANRDEFYARPALALHRWDDQTIVAGKDLQAGGTWLGVSANGRMAALTNYRDVANHRPTAPSRGDITTAFLAGSVTAQQYLGALALRSGDYNPFNLLVFDGLSLMGFESRHRRAFELPPGIHAVSNADFNTPWPKLNRLRGGFERTLAQQPIVSDLFALLSERRTAADAELPETGIPVERERSLSAEFIHTPEYGTRASSVVVLRSGSADFIERCFDANGFAGETRERLDWAKCDSD